jgi:hypothetical protein
MVGKHFVKWSITGDGIFGRIICDDFDVLESHVQGECAGKYGCKFKDYLYDTDRIQFSYAGPKVPVHDGPIIFELNEDSLEYFWSYDEDEYRRRARPVLNPEAKKESATMEL